MLSNFPPAAIQISRVEAEKSSTCILMPIGVNCTLSVNMIQAFLLVSLPVVLYIQCMCHDVLLHMNRKGYFMVERYYHIK